MVCRSNLAARRVAARKTASKKFSISANVIPGWFISVVVHHHRCYKGVNFVAEEDQHFLQPIANSDKFSP